MAKQELIQKGSRLDQTHSERSSGRDWSELTASLTARLESFVEQAHVLLRDLVKEACSVIGSAESSLLVPTGDGSQLFFFVSVNPNLEKEKMKVPIERSIAGYVFSTGNLVALGNVEEEMSDRHYEEVDEKTGVKTRAYLAVPVLAGETPAGVLTFVNRARPPHDKRFSQQEIEYAEMFAGLCSQVLRFCNKLFENVRITSKDLDRARKGDFWEVLTDEERDSLPVRIQEILSCLDEEDQRFCVEFLELVFRYRKEDSLTFKH